MEPDRSAPRGELFQSHTVHGLPKLLIKPKNPELMHSRTYDDPRAFTLIADWISLSELH